MILNITYFHPQGDVHAGEQISVVDAYTKELYTKEYTCGGLQIAVTLTLTGDSRLHIPS